VANAFQKQIEKLARFQRELAQPPSKPDPAEAASWNYAKKGYYIAVGSIVLSLLLGYIGLRFANAANDLAESSNTLAAKSTELALKADTTHQLIDSITKMLKNQQLQIAISQQEIGHLRSIAQETSKQSTELIGQGGKIGAQLTLARRQDSASLVYKKIDRDVDSIALGDTYQEILDQQNDMKLRLGYIDFYFFKTIEIDSTLAFLKRLSSMLIREKKNSYLLSDKVLYNEWMGLHTFCRGYISSRSLPVDEPGAQRNSFRVDEFEKPAQAEFNDRIYKLLIATRKKLYHF
jgi:hypothetical protein